MKAESNDGAICIYCRGDSKQSKGVEHVFPESLGPHGATLPRGAVCDGCNSYFGKGNSIDQALLAHNHIYPFVVYGMVPGKKRKARALHGVSFQPERQEIGHDLRGRSHTVAVQGSEIQITAADPKAFDMLRFRRGIYKCALNYVAHRVGVEFALGHCFDEARRYVRQPHKGEARQYMQITDRTPFDLNRLMSIVWGPSPIAACVNDQVEGRFIVSLKLLSSVFTVDLLLERPLEEWRNITCPEDGAII